LKLVAPGLTTERKPASAELAPINPAITDKQAAWKVFFNVLFSLDIVLGSH